MLVPERVPGPTVATIPQDVDGKSVLSLDSVLEGVGLRSLQGAILATCFAAIFVDGANRTGIGLVAKDFMATLKINATSLGIVFALDNLGAVVGALLCGRLTDRFGRRPVMIVTMMVIAVTTLATAHAGSFVALATIRFIGGLALGGAMPAFLTLSSEYVASRSRGTVTAVIFAGYTVGAGAGGFWSAYLLAKFPWQSIFYVGALLPVIVLAGTLLVVPESMQILVRYGRNDKAAAIAKRLRPDLEHQNLDLVNAVEDSKTGKGAIKGLFSDGLAIPTILLWIMYIFIFASIKFVVTWLPTILASNGISQSHAALVQGIWNAGALVGELFAARLIRANGPMAVMLPALILAAVAFATIGFLPANLLMVMALILTAGIGIGVAVSGVLAVSATLYPTAYRGTSIGSGVAAARFGQVISPLLIALMIDHALGDRNILLTVAVMPLTAAIMVLPFRRLGRRVAVGAL